MYCACCCNKVDNDEIEWIGFHSYRDIIYTIDMEEYDDIGGTYRDCDVEREIEYPLCTKCLENGWNEPLNVDGKEWWCDED